MASASTAHFSPGVATTVTSSRLERLFTLLATSSTAATRSLAARQLAEVVRLHPREFDTILQHLHPLLRSRQWETRIAAVDAITEVMGTLKLEASGDPSSAENESHESEGIKGFLSLNTFDLASVLESSVEMGASRGEEFELSTSTSHHPRNDEDQRRELTQKLGLDFATKFGGVTTDELFTCDDIQAHVTPLPPPPPPPHAPAKTATTATSARERNKLKRALNKRQRSESAAAAALAVKKSKMAPPRLYVAEKSRMESGVWPLRDFCTILKGDLFNEAWEVRHGAATAIREIVRLQGFGAGTVTGMDSSQVAASRSKWLQDMALTLVVVIAKDRFGDFLSDQVVAPVRESSSQALGSVADFMSGKEVIAVANILLKFLDHKDWQARHGGLLGIKYLLAMRCDLASKLLENVYPSVFLSLEDEVDDVVSVAAGALIPVAPLLLQSTISIIPLIKRLWDALKTLDDLSSSTHSIMYLLSEVLRLQSEHCPDTLRLTYSAVEAAGDLTLRLLPFVSHPSTRVRRAALTTLHTVTAKIDLAQIFLPPYLVQNLLSHVFQRALLEHSETNLGLIERVWNDVCDFTPLGPLLTSTCPLFGPWVTLITQPPGRPLPRAAMRLPGTESAKAAETEAEGEHVQQYLGGPQAAHVGNPLEKDKLVTRARWLGAKLLGKLAGFIVQPVPGMDYSKDEMPPMEMFVSKILMPSFLQSKSAYCRTAMSLVVTEWCNQHDTRDVPDSLKILLHSYLLESPNYDETEGAVATLRSETADWVSTLKHHCLQVPTVLDTCASMTMPITVDSLRCGLVDQNYDQLFANVKVGRSILKTIIERKESLAQSANAITREHNFLAVLTQACVASAVISMGHINDKLNPTIKPLMEAIKFEPNEDLQAHAAIMLAKILDICVERGTMAPVDKVIKNLVNFVSLDHKTAPQFISDSEAEGNSTIHTLNLREMRSMTGGQSKKAFKTSKLDAIDVPSPSALGCAHFAVPCPEKSRGAKVALETTVRHFHEQVFSRVPKLHELTIAAALSCKPPTKFGPETAFHLRALEVIIPALSPSLVPTLVTILPSLVFLLTNPYSDIRHLASRSMGEISKVQPVAVMSCVIEDVLPLFGRAEFKCRQGAIECLASIVEKMETEAVTWWLPLLILPVLGRMSDQNDQVRLLATNTFATLIKLVPLGSCIPDPVDLPKELATKRAEQQRFIDQLRNGKGLQDYEIPVTVNAELRGYQLVGVRWLAFLNRYHLHGILCDDMGLGKTLQAICMLVGDHFQKKKKNGDVSVTELELPSLVVCPPTLCLHWQSEMQKFVGQTDVLLPLVYAGATSARRAMVAAGELNRHNVIVSSYEVVRNDIDIIKATHWNYVVLDEGHVIKNSKAKTTQAVKQIKSNHRLILSGTPIQNSVLELWSLFDYLMPGFLGTEKQFAIKYSRPIISSRESKCSAKEKEAGALAMETLHKQVLPFILRRVKGDVLRDLPPKITQDYVVELSPIQAKLYEDFARSQARLLENSEFTGEGKTQKAHVFQALQYLRKVCNHPKLVLDNDHRESTAVQAMLRSSNSSLDDISHAAKVSALRDLLLQCGIGDGSSQSQAERIAVQHRALIFFQMKAMMDIVEKDLLCRVMPSVTYLRLDGSIAVSERQTIVDRFNGDVSIDVLLVSTSIGGMGLNLTGADTVIFMEHDWNPMKDLQAMDRAHRIGQKKIVNVYRLITRNTIEEKIMGLQEFKIKTANTVISSDNASLHSMATDSIMDLFSLKEFQPTKTKCHDEGDISRRDGKHPQISTTAVVGGWEKVLEDIPALEECEQQYAKEYNINAFMSKQTQDAKAEEEPP